MTTTHEAIEELRLAAVTGTSVTIRGEVAQALLSAAPRALELDRFLARHGATVERALPSYANARGSCGVMKEQAGDALEAFRALRGKR